MAATMTVLHLSAATAAGANFSGVRSASGERLVASTGLSPARRSFGAKLLPLKALVPNGAAAKRIRLVTRATVEDTQAELQKKVDGTIKEIQAAWDKTDDKVAIVTLAFAALITLWASIGLVGAIDKLPFLPGLLELVGIVYTGWFIYRYLLFKPDREELLKIIGNAKSKVTGQ